MNDESVERRTCCVRNCPRLGEDKIEYHHGMLDAAHEWVSIFWVCRPHQMVWDREPSLSIETSRIVTEIRQTGG